MYEGADTVVLYDELAYEDVLPVAWRAMTEQPDPIAVAAISDRNLKLLQALAAIEEHGSLEKQDENSPHAADLLRMELKINLLLDVVGQLLVTNQPRPKPVPIRFNALGAVWRAPPPHPQLGTQGLLEIHLRDMLAQPLTLIARIAAVSPEGQFKARFTPPGEHIADLIEKLAFRRHRRQVAGAKHPRR